MNWSISSTQSSIFNDSPKLPNITLVAQRNSSKKAKIKTIWLDLNQLVKYFPIKKKLMSSLLENG